MQIPLIASAFVNCRDNNQYIEIWRNSRKEVALTPFLPYFLSSYLMKIPFEKEEVIKRKLLSNLKEQELYKYTFRNTRYIPQYREDDSIESDIVFTDRIMIDDPDFFSKFPNTDHLRILHFDIEVDTTGMFPIPSRNSIIGIGCKCGDKKKLFISKTYDDDKDILFGFGNFIAEVNPDVISHYNGNFFDITYILERLKINGLPQGIFSRDNTKPKIYDNPHTKVRSVDFGGRISFDIFNEVEKDQTIYGIKNHKMKTVAKWIDAEKRLDVVEIPMSDMRSLVNTEKLREYLKSDVLITEFLFNVYFKNVLMLAEMNKIPLNLMVDSSASFLPQIVHGRAFQKLGIVSDKNNGKRYPEHIKNKQGALVDTFRPGLYLQGMNKVDFASQYPRIVQTFNISPETVKIIRYDDFTDQYSFSCNDPNRYIFSVPDKRFKKNIIIEIDMSKRGFLAQFMDEVLNERANIKKRMKLLDKNSTEYQYLHVRQNALKVIANVQTGYHGQEFARFGSLACYCLITGMGRWYAKTVIDYLITPIAVDTDGIYDDKTPNIEEINKMLDEITMKNFKLQNYLHMESESFDAAYFRKTKGKHYVLKDGDKIILHGASFKGSNQPKFFDTLLERACKDMFNGKNIREDIDITKFNIEDLVQTKRVKDKNEYKDNSSLSMNLIKQAEQIMGQTLNESEQISYIKTKYNGYQIIIPGKEYGEIDWNYYQTIANKIYERLGVEDAGQMRF